MSARDPRLSDDRVNVARNPSWEFPLVDDTLNPPARPVRVDQLPIRPAVEPLRGGRPIALVAGVLVFGIVCFILGALAGWAVTL